MTLPTSCSVCGFHQEPLCRRHAPGPVPRSHGEKPAILWPTVAPVQRCGEGDTNGSPVPCRECIYWGAPAPVAPQPNPPTTIWSGLLINRDPADKRHRRPCVRYTLSPSINRVDLDHQFTAEDDCCGDGAREKDDSDGSL